MKEFEISRAREKESNFQFVVVDDHVFLENQVRVYV